MVAWYPYPLLLREDDSPQLSKNTINKIIYIYIDESVNLVMSHWHKKVHFPLFSISSQGVMGCFLI